MKKKIITLVLIMLSAISLFGATACGKDKDAISVTFNETRTVMCNELYKPNISLSKDTKIVKIELISPNGEVIPVANDYSFTPTSYGRYIYRITVSRNGEEKIFMFDVTSIDGTIPVIKSMPADKTVEIGLYSGFGEDVYEAVVEDDNVDALKYLARKVVKIEFGGKVLCEDVNGITNYLLQKTGVYKITVAFSDVAGGTVYGTYNITAHDNVKPIINNFPTYYVWAENGKVDLPEIEAYDLSGCTTTVTVKKAGSPITITDNQVPASAGDVFTMDIQATDGYENPETATAKLKVLEKGVILDGNEEDFAKLFVAENSFVEYKNGGVAFTNNTGSDTVAWRDSGYFYHYDTSFNALKLAIRSYGQNEGSILVSAIDKGKKVFIGKVELGSSQGDYKDSTYTLDITKADLKNIEGWIFDYASDANDARFIIKGMEFTSYASDYLTVADLQSSVKVNEPIKLGTLTVNGGEVSETYANVYKMNGENATLVNKKVAVGSTYAFATEGIYKIEFVADCGNKVFNTSKTITVEGASSASISFNSPFVGGVVGQSYTLPNSTVIGGEVQITVLDPNNNAVTLSGNNSFTPSKAGVYTASYKVGEVSLGSYKFAIENANTLDFEKAGIFDLKVKYNGGLKENEDDRYVASGLRSARVDLPANSFAGGLFKASYALTGSVNHVKANVYASTSGSVRLSLFIGDSNTEHITNTFALAEMVGKADYKVVARKGQFYILDKNTSCQVNHIVLPIPTKITKGKLMCPTIHGNMLVGPTAEDQPSKVDKCTTAEGLESIAKDVRNLVPNVNLRDTITQYSGLRPNRNPEGLHFDMYEDLHGYINLSGVRSTGLTLSIAMGKYVVQQMLYSGAKIVLKDNFISKRKGIVKFAEQTREEQDRLIKENPLYGNVICRCETITEAEILDAIHRPLGAKSVDAVKRRVRAGMGRCQGGFCGPKVIEILAREWKVSAEEINKNNDGSYMVTGKTR